jgi:hypothetical protein
VSLWDDFDCEMQRLPLDVQTADRLLSGSVPPEDAPPGFGEVASLIAAASAVGPASRTREEQTLAMLVAAVRSSHNETNPPPRRSSVHRLKIAAAAATAALACATGLAFAGSLPGAAQDVASDMLALLGVTVPGPNENAGTNPGVRGQSSEDVAADATTTSETDAEETSGKGAEISQLATTTELTGVEKGAAVSTAASGGKSQAGQHGQAGEAHGQATEEHGQAGEAHGSAPAATDTEHGAATADAASQGHSSAGADNATAGQSHRPSRAGPDREMRAARRRGPLSVGPEPAARSPRVP